MKVVKNKVAPPFKQAEFEIIYGQGISREGEIIDIGTDMDIFNKSGAWYSYQGNKIGQGKAAAREWLKSHPEEMKMIEETDQGRDARQRSRRRCCRRGRDQRN